MGQQTHSAAQHPSADARVHLHRSCATSHLPGGFYYDRTGAMCWLQQVVPDLLQHFDERAQSLLNAIQQTTDPTAFALLVFALGHRSTQAFDMSAARSPVKIIMHRMTTIPRLVAGNPSAAAGILDLVVYSPDVACHVPWMSFEKVLTAPTASSEQAIHWLQQLPEDWRDQVHGSRRVYLMQGITAALSTTDDQQHRDHLRQADRQRQRKQRQRQQQQQQQQQQQR